MHPKQTFDLHYLLTHFNLTSSNSTPPTNHLHISPNPSLHPLQGFNNTDNKNSTSDEAEEQQLNIINDRKQRRMISNRESARRSRMRKQKHLDELWSQVVWLRNENQVLMDKLNRITESRDLAVQENAQLKGEAMELRLMVSDMRISSPYRNLGELVDEPCIDLP